MQEKEPAPTIDILEMDDIDEDYKKDNKSSDNKTR
jgi:hypothetical protein